MRCPPLLPGFTVLLGLVAMTSCGPAAIDGGFDSANPAAKLYAIEDAARRGDRSALHAIVEQLDSDDPAVRFVAISALERLTGETHGYRHDDPSFVREAAIRRWVDELDGNDDTGPPSGPIQMIETHG